jgi:hypothetical protein
LIPGMHIELCGHQLVIDEQIHSRKRVGNHTGNRAGYLVRLIPLKKFTTPGN